MSAENENDKTEVGDKSSRSRLVPVAIGVALTIILGGWFLLGTKSGSPIESVTYKSAKTGSSYYQMGVELAERIKVGTDSSVIVTIEESQGSVQNVMEVRARGSDYVFTAPPTLINLARDGREMFEGRESPAFKEIRALFPIPSLTMHFVVTDSSGIKRFADLEGKKILLGSGSFSAREGAKYIDLFGLGGKVNIVNGELSNAVAALKNGQIDGFVTAGSYPAPKIIEAAASTSVGVLSMTPEQVAATKRMPIVIPAGTYAKQDTDIQTTTLPIVVFTTTAMSDETAYMLTKTFWEQREALAAKAAWWAAVSPDILLEITIELHPGAARYYEEAGILLSTEQR